MLGPVIFWAALARCTVAANGYLDPPGCRLFQSPDDWPILGIVLSLVAGLPYLHVLWRLRGPQYRKGLALATFTALGGLLVLPAALIFAGPSGVDSGKLVGATLIIISQGLLAAFSIKAYRAAGRAGADAPKLLFSLIPPVLYFILFVPSFLVADLDLFPPRRPNEDSPAVTLMVLNMQELDYASHHGGSFSPTLDFLGAVSQPKLTAHRFVYTAGPPDAAGTIKTYTLLAVPTEPCPGKCSCSFYMDGTGILRMTRESRPATAHDPPLTPEQQGGRGAWPEM